MADPFLLRRAVASDIPSLAADHLRAYPSSSASLAERIERFRARSVDPITVAEHAGRVIGQACTLPLRGWLGGRESRVGGLAGVAVAPEARRGGVAVALCREHLARLRADGTPWSMLYPFASTFYARLGWRQAGRKARWRFPPRALPLYPDRWRVSRLALDDATDFEAVQATYAANCQLVSGSLSRSDDLLRATMVAGGRTFAVGVRRAGGGLDGYLLYTVDAPTFRPQTLVVRDVVSLDPGVERAFFGFLAAQADQCEQVLVETPVQHPIGALLDMGLPPEEELKEHVAAGTVYQGIMARVVDLGAALVGRGYPGGDGVVAFAATDRELPANDAPVTLVVAAGAVKVQPGRRAGAPLVRGDIGEISRVLVGAMKLRHAARLNLVEIEGDLAAADTLLGLPVPYPSIIF